MGKVWGGWGWGNGGSKVNNPPAYYLTAAEYNIVHDLERDGII